MAVRKIMLAGEPVLKQVAEPVQKINREITTLLKDMRETMQEANGVGLAAPQVGVSLRVILIDAGEGPVEYINPVLSDFSEEKEDMTEGCLSIPGYVGIVERSTGVTVTYKDRRGKERRLRAKGLLAQALQHEVDHLDGILYIEKAKSLYRESDLEEQD